MPTFEAVGDWSNTEKFLQKMTDLDFSKILASYAREGVSALSNATPKETGETAASWDYTIKQGRGRIEIEWTNSNVNQGANIAVLIQYGHGTRGGGYVQGIDYINPALRPVFDKIAEEIWRQVKS